VIKIFEGHQSEVIMINLNPSDDTFVSVSKTAELKVFDLSSETSSPEAELSVGETGYNLCANFDITGVVLAVSVFKKENEKSMNRIDLYDVKKYHEEECRFDSWRLDQIPEIVMIKFSNSGAYILICTVQSKIIVLDAFEGKLIAEFGGFANINGKLLEASFTPDSIYIIGGSEDGTVNVWDIEKRIEVCKLEGHIKPSKHVKFNPYHVMMASACQNVLFWIPKFLD
jgi:COMPASS component SWD2